MKERRRPVPISYILLILLSSTSSYLILFPRLMMETGMAEVEGGRSGEGHLKREVDQVTRRREREKRG